MKKLRYITILVIAIIVAATNLSATGGYTKSSAGIFSAVLSDTTEPTDPPKAKANADTTRLVLADTSELEETEPPAHSHAPVADATGIIEEDVPAGDLYDDWDTTAIHAEKFDALLFADTLQLVLSDSVNGTYVHPFDGHVTSCFGFRRYRYHFGVDIKLQTGDSVKCAFDGKVRIAQRSRTYGYVVVVRHNNGLETYYAHLSRLMVSPGDDLKAGSVLGLGGNTGHSHGSHLHFEVRFRGQAVNPSTIIDFDNKCLKADTFSLTRSDFKYLSETFKVRHYSRKRKKTWYTYYTAGGAHYATPEAKRIMKGTAEPATASSGTATASSSKNATAASPPVAKTAPAGNAGTSKTTTTKSTASGSKTYHSIKKGETLSGLAVKYKTSVTKLCQLNGIKKTSKLQIGQKIRVK
ncbi:MAG TPA: peptidoglycan DD-metalloendopeptidase family protein [Bacteroidia bacterium]|nr:peptidoglycan DD-metalloendopeptidase family protein [Bacteroidia bacterium]